MTKSGCCYCYKEARKCNEMEVNIQYQSFKSYRW